MDTETRIIGLDIGEKRTGIAVSDPSHQIAFPHSQFEARSHKEWFETLTESLEGYNLDSIVVGFPLNQYGEEGQDAVNIAKYVALLRDRLGIPVVEWDERYTTWQAERTLLEGNVSRRKRKQVIDKVAATIILQSYLDSKASPFAFETSEE